MNKIRNYWKNKKGITLVWGAFFLVLCLMFLGLAVDIAYMYVAKNQLQVAADAAALAGAANLTWELDDTTLNPNVLQQEVARQQAWKFACKNKAGTESADNPEARVYLVTNTPSDCDANPPPAADNLNGGISGNNRILRYVFFNIFKYFFPACDTLFTGF